MIKSTLCLVVGVAATTSLIGAAPAPRADLVFYDARIWTVDPDLPTASAVAIKNDRIVYVGNDASALAMRGPNTVVVDLDGKMVLPGFIDAHTHFENAVDDYFSIRLNDIEDEAALMAELEQRLAAVPAQFWVTGGDWSARAGFSAMRDPASDYTSFAPSLAQVDRLTPDRPVLLRRYDGAAFINSRGLELFHIDRNSPDPSGGRYGRDSDGNLDGMLYGTAATRALQTLPPRSRAQTMFAARALVGQLNALGITGIHDIARVPEISERQIFDTAVERSFSDVSIFWDLRKEDALSLRVSPILTLRTWEDLAGTGIAPGSGDSLIEYGALKFFVGGFLMSRPFKDKPNYSGSLSFRNRDEAQLHDETIAADAAGWDLAGHVTGDKGHALTIDWYEAARKANGHRAADGRERRDRVIHVWYPGAEEIRRGGEMKLVADVTPYHLLREADSIERKLWPNQIETAFAWRSMIDAGWRINIVSDWPGSYDGSHPAPNNPLENIFYAVTRGNRDAKAGSGYHLEQGLTIDEAIAALTINPAWTSHNEASRGSITPGKFADLVVLSHDIRSGPPQRLLDARVLATVFNGRIVYRDPATVAP